MKLAVNGGPKVRERMFPGFNTIGDEEKAAVLRVLDSGALSKYLGSWGDYFRGGEEVRALEEEWAAFFDVKHAIAVNSATSGLYAAVGAMSVSPGDEVIVTPYTMSATAMAPLVYGAIPVFADVEPDYFCLDVESVRSRITPRTRGILVVDLFGMPYDRMELNRLAREHGLWIVEDTAQAPYARHGDAFAGTLADAGVFSLNYHKHIHCGEGGVVCIEDDQIADRVRLIRNHAESVVEAKGESNLRNMVGFNYRLTELQAAVTRCQLPRLQEIVEARQENCAYLEEKLSGLPGITIPGIRPGCTHAYYAHVFLYDERETGVSRERFHAAVAAELAPAELREKEGVRLFQAYAKPLYLLPVFQKRTAFGAEGYPWNGSDVDYSKGICPVVERLHEKELIGHEYMHHSMSRADLDDVARAFAKVSENLDEIRE